MDDLLLVHAAMILLLGTLVSALASKLNISNAFFLYFAGMVLGAVGLVAFKTETIVSISSLAVVFVVFESTVKLKLKDINRFTHYSMSIILLSFAMHMVIITAMTFLLFPINADPYVALILSLVFASLIYGIDHDITLVGIDRSGHHNSIVKILEVESLINRFLTIILPLVLLNYLSSILSVAESSGFPALIFFKQVILGTVIGLAAGGIVLLILNTKIHEDLGYLVVITSSIVTFVITEMAGANGVLSLTFFSLIFGNFHVKHKKQLEKFTFLFSYIFNIFVFILIGTQLLIGFEYIVYGSLLFGAYLAIRFVSIAIALRKNTFSIGEKVFMSLNVPKGIDVAIIVLLMITKYGGVSGIETIKNLTLLFCLYSITISNILSLFTKGLLARQG